MMNESVITRLRRKVPLLRLLASETEGAAPIRPVVPPVVPEPALTRQPLEQLLSAPALTRPVEPIATPESLPSEMVPLRRSVQPLNPIPEVNPLGFDPATTPMVVYNNKGRPTGVEGGGDVLTRNRALQEAQEGYKAPFSKKDFLLSSLSSFLQRGLPGVVGNALGFADPAYRK